MIRDELSEKRKELESLCVQYRVIRLSLFGSAARDNFGPGSDLDFSVTFRDMSAAEHATAYFGLLEDLEKLFKRNIDLVELSAVRNPFLRRSIEDGQETVYAAA